MCLNDEDVFHFSNVVDICLLNMQCKAFSQRNQTFLALVCCYLRFLVGEKPLAFMMWFFSKKFKIFAQIQARDVYFLKHSARVLELLTVQKLLSKRWPKVIFQDVDQRSYFKTCLWITCHQRIFFPKFDFEMIHLAILKKNFKANFVDKILDFLFVTLLLSRNSNPNFGQLVAPYTNDCNSLDSYRRNQNFCSNSRFQCLISKTFGSRQRIPYLQKVMVEIVTEGHFSTHFQSD